MLWRLGAVVRAGSVPTSAAAARHRAVARQVERTDRGRHRTGTATEPIKMVTGIVECRRSHRMTTRRDRQWRPDRQALCEQNSTVASFAVDGASAAIPIRERH